MTFLIALAALFLALLAGTAIEFPRLCSEGWDGIEVSQAGLVSSPPYCRHGLTPWSVLPLDYSCASESVTKSVSSPAATNAHRSFDVFCQPPRIQA
jgi:hypothetical protein